MIFPALNSLSLTFILSLLIITGLLYLPKS